MFELFDHDGVVVLHVVFEDNLAKVEVENCVGFVEILLNLRAFERMVASDSYMVSKLCECFDVRLLEAEVEANF